VEYGGRAGGWVGAAAAGEKDIVIEYFLRVSGHLTLCVDAAILRWVQQRMSGLCTDRLCMLDRIFNRVHTRSEIVVAASSHQML
jgi:hypothetical protein